MKSGSRSISILVLGLVLGSFLSPADGQSTQQDEALSYWPQWRGPLGTGVAPLANPPIRWSEEENVRWKVSLPGVGHSTPIVWKDRIFLTAASPYGEGLEPRYSDAPGSHDNLPVTHSHEFIVLAVDRENGKILWQNRVHQEMPVDQGHHTGSLASQSPVTDGQLVIASFGSYGVYCLDLDGTLVWEKDLGEMKTLHGHGEGSSLVLYGDTLVVNWDHEGPSFIVALNKWTGEEIWRRARDEVTSWSTPIVVEQDGKVQVVVNGTHRIRGYDIETGETIWECGGLSSNVVASPVAGDGMVFAGSSYEKRALLAIRLADAQGDVTGTPHVAWQKNRGTPYVPSPLLYHRSLYYFHHYQGVLSRADIETGKDDGPFRLEGIRDVYASPLGAAGRVYIIDRSGKTMVMTHSTEPGILALNRLDDTMSASPAAVGRDLFLRGEEFLYCLSEEEGGSY